MLADSGKREDALAAARQMARVMMALETDDDFFPEYNMECICKAANPHGLTVDQAISKIEDQIRRANAQAELFHLPEDQIPHSLIAFGYPDEAPEVKGPEWEEDRVHFEEW